MISTVNQVSTKRQQNDKNKILISGAYGTDNLGDTKILAGLATLSQKKYDPKEVIAASIDPEKTNQVPGVDRAILNFEKNPSGWIKEIRDIDLIILGGGSVIGGMFSRRHSFVITISKILNKTVFITGGISYFEQLEEMAVKNYLHIVDGIVIRDNISKERLRSIGIEEPIDVVPDPAFININKEFDPKEIDKEQSSDYILVCIRDTDNFDQSGDFYGQVNALDKLNHKTTSKIVLFPFHRATGGDVDYAKKLQTEMETDVDVYDKNYTIQSAEKIISDADHIIAMRLHSMILAAHQRTSFTPITYHSKCDGFLHKLNISKPIEHSNIDPKKFLKQTITDMQNESPIVQNNQQIDKLESGAQGILKQCESQNRDLDRIRLATLFILLLPLFIKQVLSD